jgi:hypothetical protein
MPNLTVPDFESAVLWDIAIAVARRGKAIRSWGTLELSRAIEEFKRLNLDFTGISRFHVRLVFGRMARYGSASPSQAQGAPVGGLTGMSFTAA